MSKEEEKQSSLDTIRKKLDTNYPDLEKVLTAANEKLLSPIGDMLIRSTNNLSDAFQLGVDLFTKDLKGKSENSYWRYSYC